MKEVIDTNSVTRFDNICDFGKLLFIFVSPNLASYHF